MEEQIKRPRINNKNIEHDCVNLDSLVQFYNPDLLKIFNNTNKLQINDDKTNSLAANKPNKKKQAEELELKIDKKIVKPQEHIKIVC